MMKLKQVVKMFQEAIDAGVLTGNEVVVMSKDGEGNEYSPLSEYGHLMYLPNNTWSGEVLTFEEYEEEGLGGGKPAVVLWPTN